MHAKAITGSYQRTRCDTVKSMSGLIGAGFITTDGGPALTVKYARIEAEGQVLRYTLDGSTPTTTSGHRLAAGAMKTFTPSELRTIKILEETASGYASVTLFSS